MRRNTLLIDAGIAAILTILVVVLSPGLAVVGLIALVVVLICAVSFARDARRRKRTRARREASPLRGLRRDLSDAQPSRRTAPRRAPPPRRPRPRP